MIKIALGGPPHSGKSVLRERLKQSLILQQSGCYPYFWPACPDGEGAWFQQAVQNNPIDASEQKKRAKQAYTYEHAESYANTMRNITLPLSIADLGGRIDAFNRRICVFATHIILISGTAEGLDEWRAFANECNLTILAELISDYQGTTDTVHELGPPLKGSIHYLERGELQTPRPAVDALARLILSLIPADTPPSPGQK
jgi:CRISPR-associated protein Csx3